MEALNRRRAGHQRRKGHSKVKARKGQRQK